MTAGSSLDKGDIVKKTKRVPQHRFASSKLVNSLTAKALRAMSRQRPSRARRYRTNREWRKRGRIYLSRKRFGVYFDTETKRQEVLFKFRVRLTRRVFEYYGQEVKASAYISRTERFIIFGWNTAEPDAPDEVYYYPFPLTVS